MTCETAYIGLGSNLDDPVRQLQTAVAALAALPGLRLVRVSSFYRSAAVGYREQPDFVNAVAQVETQLAPRELLDRLLELEHHHGRVRTFQNAPRTLDLDIVLYGERVVHEPGLSIPHPRMQDRAFVLVPLAEIAPGVTVPGYGSAGDLARNVPEGSVIRLTEHV